MLKMFVFALAAVLLVTVKANPVPGATTPAYEVIHLEEGCVRQGGMCLRIEDCEEGSFVQIGFVNLCPKQAHRGITCCYM